MCRSLKRKIESLKHSGDGHELIAQNLEEERDSTSAEARRQLEGPLTGGSETLLGQLGVVRDDLDSVIAEARPLAGGSETLLGQLGVVRNDLDTAIAEARRLEGHLARDRETLLGKLGDAITARESAIADSRSAIAEARLLEGHLAGANTNLSLQNERADLAEDLLIRARAALLQQGVEIDILNQFYQSHNTNQDVPSPPSPPGPN